MEPGVVGLGPGFIAAIGVGVGPFAGEGSVEALDFAVGLGSVSASTAVFDVRGLQGVSKGVGSVTRPVVRDDFGDSDPDAREVGPSARPETGRGFFALVLQDLWSAAMFSDCPQPECDDFYAANVSGP